MLTFTQYLIERFLTGFEGLDGKYTEVYVNPDRSELQELGNASRTRQLGAWIVGPKAYVWNRDIASHGIVRSAYDCRKCNISSDSIPLYLDYTSSTNILKVSFALYSTDRQYLPDFGKGLELIEPATIDKLVAFCQKHPAFKKFKVVAG